MILREISLAWNYLRTEGLKKTLLSRDTPLLIQFGKYGICGILSVVIFLLVTTLGEHLFPAYFSPDLPERTRALHNIPLHLAAFLPSNFTAYALNRWLVFTPGKHPPRKELALFTLISFISFAIGEALPFLLVDHLNIPNTLAHISFVLSSALINFACRKLLVFKN